MKFLSALTFLCPMAILNCTVAAAADAGLNLKTSPRMTTPAHRECRHQKMI